MKNKMTEQEFELQMYNEEVKRHEEDFKRQKELGIVLGLDFEKRNDVAYLCVEFVKSFNSVWVRKKVGGFEDSTTTNFFNSEFELLKVRYLVDRLNKNLHDVRFIPEDCKKDFCAIAKSLPTWNKYFGDYCKLTIADKL